MGDARRLRRGVESFRDSLVPPTIRNAQRIRFYRELWRKADLEQVRTVDDLRLLPVMDRVDYQDRFHLFWTDEMLSQTFLVTYTSGTTGEPLYRYRSEEELDYIRRFFTSLNRSGRHSGGQPLVVETRSAEVAHGGAIRIPFPGTVVAAPMNSASHVDHLTEVLATPHRIGGEQRYVEGINIGAHELVILTSVLAERGVDPARAFRLRWARISGGYLNRAAVRRISAFWGIRVQDHFSLSEIFGGAWQCPACGLYHPDPFVAAEVLDYRTGVRIDQGPGMLVLTELYPFVQTHPFIRYWTGDLVETAPGDCGGSSMAFRYIGRTYVRRDRTMRAPFRLREEDATEGAILDEDGTLLVRPAPLLDLLGDQEGIARWGIWGECSDPLGLGRPRFALRLEPGQPSVVRLCVSVIDRSLERGCTLAGIIDAALLSQNPELAERVASNRVVVEITLAGEGTEPPWADPYAAADHPAR